MLILPLLQGNNYATVIVAIVIRKKMTQEDAGPREVSEELRRHLEGREDLAQAQRTGGQSGTHKLSEAWSV